MSMMTLLEARTEAKRQKRELEGIGYCEHGHHDVELDELVTLHKEKICKACRGKFSECCGAEVQDYLGWGVMDIVKEPEENMLGECSKCCKDQIYSKKSGWQNNE